jgi:ubiquinone/menaquinone biosynthesis C-methylase UbiE
LSLLRSSRETSSSTYERWAWLYDRSRIINFVVRRWHNRLIGLKPETPIIDLGCGPGRLVAKLTGNGFDEVYGFDLSSSCLKITRSRPANSQAGLARGFIENLPFKENSFASAVLSGVFHHLEEPAVALAEIARILRSSGTLYIIDPLFPPGVRQIVNLTLDVYPVGGDRRFYVPRGIVEMADSAGLVKKDVVMYPFSYILILEKC